MIKFKCYFIIYDNTHIEHPPQKPQSVLCISLELSCCQFYIEITQCLHQCLGTNQGMRKAIRQDLKYNNNNTTTTTTKNNRKKTERNNKIMME